MLTPTPLLSVLCHLVYWSVRASGQLVVRCEPVRACRQHKGRRGCSPLLSRHSGSCTVRQSRQAMRQAGATILIDDSLENALDIAHDSNPPGHVLLFGGEHTCPWNRRESRAVSQEDMLSYEERRQRGMRDDEYGPLPYGITRVDGWHEVLQVFQ